MATFQDLQSKCRLCFIKVGENDVTTAPILQKTIHELYGIEIKETDRYTKMICADCTSKMHLFTFHKKLVESGQSLYSALVEMHAQMSHMKIESDAVPPNVMNIVQVVKEEEEEEEEEEDLDDQMTESPPDLHVEEPLEPESERSVHEPVQASTSRKSMQEPNREKDRPHAIRNESRSDTENQNVRQKDGDKGQSEHRSKQNSNDARNKQQERRSNHTQKENDKIDAPQPRTSAIAGRIKDRRQTMVSLQRPNTPNLVVAVRKRRLSVVGSRSSETTDKNRNQSQKDDEIETNKAKKMKTSDGTKEKLSSTITVASRRAPDTTPIKRRGLYPTTSTPIASSSFSSNRPIKGQISNRDKKNNLLATPPITQFFAQKSPVFRCETCVVVLKSQNEVNFHSRTHKKGRCTKCKKAIDNTCRDSIDKHMISCLFLDRKIPKKRLAKFFKVKLDITRLTPEKIEEIRKKLSSNLQCTSKKPAPKSKQREIHEKEVKNKVTSQTEEKYMEKNSLSMDTTKNGVEKRMDTSTKSVNDHVNDDKNGKKSKNKKTPSKIKSTEKEINEEFIIVGNQSAALNWIDEKMKEKPFVLRNFETEKPTYLDINKDDQPVLDRATKEKIAFLIDSIKTRKDQLCSAENNKISRPINLTISSVCGNNRYSSNVPTNVPVQSQQQSPKLPSNVHASQINMTQSLSGPSRITSPVAVPSPNIAIAQDTSTPNTVISNAQSRLNTPTMPQLLTLPNRVTAHRSRAVSVHMSQAEYSANARLPARRQSVSDKETGLTSSPSSRNVQPLIPYQQQQHATPPPLHLKFMTHVHDIDFLQNPVNRTSEAQPERAERTERESRIPSTLKILTPDDLNSRAMNVSQTVPATQNQRIDSPNSTENNTNANNSNEIKRVSSTKRPRTKTTPLRLQPQASPPPTISDDADISISVSLSRLGNDLAELVLTLNEVRLDFDLLTPKRQSEVQSSLLKDDVWKKMLDFLKTIKPTHETLDLFQKILPKSQYDIFVTELKHVYGSRLLII